VKFLLRRRVPLTFPSPFLFPSFDRRSCFPLFPGSGYYLSLFFPFPVFFPLSSSSAVFSARIYCLRFLEKAGNSPDALCLPYGGGRRALEKSSQDSRVRVE